MKVGVVGLGKLGSCMATVYSKYGFEVVGVDTNQETVLRMMQKQCPIEAVEEKGLAELLQTVPLKVSSDYGALRGCEIIIVIVPTPSRADGRYDNTYIMTVLKSLCKEVATESVKPVVVIKSTVAPGSCDKEFIPVLSEVGIGLCYSPEMVGLGDVVRGLESPEELLIGEQNRETGGKLQEFYRGLFSRRKMPSLVRMSCWSAELSKLALNVFLINKVNLANIMGRLCDQSPKGNVEDVLAFVGGDSRIGGKFLETGLGMGGTCFPRDCNALISVAGDANSDIPKAVDNVNITQADYIYDSLRPLPQTVAVLGVTYKPETQLVNESRVLLLVSRMMREGVDVRIHDPKGVPEARKILGENVYYATSIEDCLMGAELTIIGTAWDCYRNMDIGMIKRHMEKPVVYDCWRIWKAEEMYKYGIKYHAFGIGDKGGALV